MNDVVTVYDDPKKVPFGMIKMQQPSAEHVLPTVGLTMTTTYSTDCGPSSSPDDGASDTKDD